MSFFRNLFGRRSDAGKSDGTATLSPPEPPMPAVPVTRPQIIAPAASHPATPTPAPAPAPTPPPEPSEGPISPEYCVPLPLKAITDLFPQELKSTLRKNPSEHVHVGIPRSLIEPQLAGGAVRITFAQLRAATPEIFFHPQGGPNDAKVVIPLDAILRELMPARRQDQREISIPGNIPSVFSKSGAPDQPHTGASADPWYSHRRPTYDGPGTEIPSGEPESALPIPAGEAIPAPEPAEAAAPAKPAPEPAPERILRMPAIEHAAPAKPAPAAPEPISASIPPLPAAEPAPKAPEPAPASILPIPASFLPIPAAEPAKPARPAPAETPKPEAVSTVPKPPAPKPEPPAPVVAEVPPAPAAPADSVPVALTTILPMLPAEIRHAMNGLDPATRSFHIPLEDFGTQMRSGKLRFKWSKLQGWCRPEPFAATAGDVDVDLPLAELVPLFMAKRKAPDVRKKFEIDPRIPDVFGKSNIPAPASTPTPAPEPVAEVVPPPAPEVAPEPAPEPAPIPAAEAIPTPAAAPEPIPEPAPESATPEPDPTPAAEFVPAPAIEPEPEPAPEPSPITGTTPAPEAPAPPAPAGEPAPVPVNETAPEPVPFPAAASSASAPSLLIPPGPTITPFRLEQPPTGPAASHQTGAPANPSTQALQRIRALDGVTGAFLATADGLLIAADLPDGNENILAAFAPTVFAQLSKYCDMSHLGQPISIDLHLGLTNIHVRKAGKVFLGVISTNGRPLPLPELNLIAATLQPHAS